MKDWPHRNSASPMRDLVLRIYYYSMIERLMCHRDYIYNNESKILIVRQNESFAKTFSLREIFGM